MWYAFQTQCPGYADCVADAVKAVYQPGNVLLPQGGAGLVASTSVLPPALHS